MEDDELARIREQRLAQLKASQNQKAVQNRANVDGDPEAKERSAKEAEIRNNILSAVLTQDARSRLATISVAKPERGRMVEDIIIQNARMGSLRGKVDEDALKNLLQQVTEKTKKETKVSYQRRYEDDDDDDF